MKLLLHFTTLVMLLLSACTAAPSSTPRPTAAPPTRTPLPRATPTQKPVSIRACVTDSTLRIRSGPSKEQEVIGGMVSGTCMSILGRNEDSTWVYMVSEDSKTGWVAASLLTIEGDIRQVSIRSASQVLSLVPNTKLVPTQKVLPTATRKPVDVFTNTPPPLLSRFRPLCSDAAIGERVSCQIPRAYCDYRPDVDGGPTFCNDKPYPNQDFTLIIFGEDWSDFDGSCIMVSGYVERYGDHLQIQAVSRSQVSYCN